MRLLCRLASMCFFTFCQQGSNYRVTTAGESSVTASGVTRYCLLPMLASPSISLYCLLAVFVLCSVTLTWDSPLFQPYHEHYCHAPHSTVLTYLRKTSTHQQRLNNSWNASMCAMEETVAKHTSRNRTKLTSPTDVSGLSRHQENS